MEQTIIRKEIDQLILRCIAEYGYDAIPYDFSFMTRYKLFFSFYYNTEMNRESGSAGFTDSKNTFQSLVTPHIYDCSFKVLKLYYQVHGEIQTRSLLYEKTMYLDYLIKNYIQEK